MIDPASCLELRINQEDCVLIVQFDPIHYKQIVKYCVTVFENDSKASLFFMEKINERWRVINAPQVDSRFMQMESLFSDFLDSNDQKQNNAG